MDFFHDIDIPVAHSAVVQFGDHLFRKSFGLFASLLTTNKADTSNQRHVFIFSPHLFHASSHKVMGKSA